MRGGAQKNANNRTDEFKFCSVLFCSVRANCVLKTFLKSRQFSFSHNKDHLAKCRYGILRAVFLRFGNNGCSLMLTSDVLPSLTVALKNRLSLFRRKTMAYTKPQVIAQNASTGSYAAGCPVNEAGTDNRCRDCERTR